jgi:hypothetical protein
MNRCQRHSPTTAPPKRRLMAWALTSALGLLLLTPFAGQSQTNVRPFPAAAKRGTLEVKLPPEVLLNGNPARLSPGARIRTTNDMLVMSGHIVGQRLTVNYTVNPQGLLHEVWILSEVEAAAPRQGKGPVTNITFGSDADKPKVDDGKTPYNQLPGYQKP